MHTTNLTQISEQSSLKFTTRYVGYSFLSSFTLILARLWGRQSKMKERETDSLSRDATDHARQSEDEQKQINESRKKT